DGSIAAYQWTQTAGTTVLLSGATTASASFTAPTLTSAETLRFEVTVTDNENATTSAPVSVLVEPVNALPTVSAGNHQTVDEATSVTLNASASDDDGSIAAYQWTQTAGTTVLLSGATTASASFTAPTLTSAETLRFEVMVTDNENATTSAPVSVLVEPVNALPTVSAGNHQTVDEATSVTLNASASD
ncbi:PKD domain-containing protein, partial [Echinimonas agarilytica]|nr:peptidase M36 [Echinimonas agarilytica]